MLCKVRKGSARVRQGFGKGSARVRQGFGKGSARVRQGFSKGSARVRQGFGKGSVRAQVSFVVKGRHQIWADLGDMVSGQVSGIWLGLGSVRFR